MKNLKIVFTSFAVMSSLASTLSYAQSAEETPVIADKGKIEMIMVTADKRVQSLQSVPIAVTAFNEESIEKLRIEELGDVAANTPNFVIGQQSPTQPELTIRGIGSTDREAGSERSVALFVDEVYVGRAGASTFDLFDLERIEVLRGPQGTLYGRNVVGGAVNIISTKPSHEFRSKIQVTLGSDSLTQVRGLVNGGLSENVSAKVSFGSKQRDGFYHNAIFDENSNDLESYSLRSQLLYEPSDELKALLTVEFSKDEITGIASKITQGQATDEDFAAALGPFGAYVPSADLYSVDNNKFGGTKRDSVAIYSRIDWTFPNSETILTFIPAFRTNSLEELRDIAGIPLIGSGADTKGFESTAINDEEYDALSFELRYASDSYGDRDINWITGLYYLNEDIARDQIRERQANTGFSRPLFDQHIDSTSMAAFAQLTWDVSEQLSITGGLRYTKDEKDFDMAVVNTLSAAEQAAILADLGRAPSLNPASEEYTASATKSWSQVNHKLTADWQVSDDILLYITSSSGYKSGGFSGLAATQTLAALAFDEETVDNLEAGFKGLFFDDRFQLNFNVFNMDFEDLQLRDRQLLIPDDPTSAVVTIVNAGEAKIDGVEAEFIIAVTEQLRLTGSYAVLDTEIVKVEDGSTLIKGTQLPRAPKNSFTLGVDFTIPLTGGVLSLGTNYRRAGELFFDINEQLAGKETAYSVWDARVEYSATGNSDWSIALWGKNISDEEYRTHVQSIRTGRAGVSQIGDSGAFGVTYTHKI